MEKIKSSVIAISVLLCFIVARIIGLYEFAFNIGNTLLIESNEAVTIDANSIKLFFSFIVSIVAMFLAGRMLFLKKGSTEQKWAYGTIGTVLGYWIG